MKDNIDLKLLNEKGQRMDGRKFDELRPIKIDANVLKRADGSAYLEWGGNKILAAVYGPREAHPRYLQDPTKAIVQCRYNMAAFSVMDRKRPGPDRRSTEISKILSEALEYIAFTEQFPRTSIDVFIEIIQAEAGTRCSGLTAASVAMADAGIPMRDLIASCAFGKVEGNVVLDLSKEEDNFGEADVPMAIVPRTEEIVLLQMDGHLTSDEFDQGLKMCTSACKHIYELQRKALQNRYATVVTQDETPKEMVQ
jgi:exosome complex component RRP41